MPSVYDKIAQSFIDASKQIEGLRPKPKEEDSFADYLGKSQEWQEWEWGLTPQKLPQPKLDLTKINKALRSEGIPTEAFDALGLTKEQTRTLIKTGEYLSPTNYPGEGRRMRIEGGGEGLSFMEKIYRFQTGDISAEELPEPVRALGKAGKAAIAASEAELFKVAGVPISAGDIAALALIGFGIHQVGSAGWNMLLNRVLSKPGDLNFLGRKLVRAGLNKYLNIHERQLGIKIPKGTPATTQRTALVNAGKLPPATREEFIQRYLKDMADSWARIVAGQGKAVNVRSLQLASQNTYAQTANVVNREIQALITSGTQTGAMARGGIGKPAQVIKVLPSPHDTELLKTSQVLGKKIGLDVEAIGGISEGEYWVSVTPTKIKPIDAFNEWVNKFDNSTEIKRLLVGKFEFRETEPSYGRGRFLPFKNIQDANKFLTTGDISLVTRTITQRGTPWTPEKLRATREAIARPVAPTPEPLRAPTGLIKPEIRPVPKAVPEVTEVVKETTLPEGWQMGIGKTRTKEGYTAEAEIDWKNKRIVFRDKESMANPEIVNHEIAHVIFEGLPDNIKSKLLDEYANLKESEWETKGWTKEWIVKNQFHREEIIIDHTQYLTDASKLKPEIKAFFDRELPVAKPPAVAKPPVTPTPPVTPPPMIPPTPPTPPVTPPPPTPPVTPPPVVPPAEDPVKKLTRLIKSAKPVRKETELLKHEELRKRVGAYAGALKVGEGEQAFLKAKGALVGELPQAVFEPPRPQLAPDDITGLFNTIRDSDILPFQKLNTSEALSSILGGKLPTRGDIVLLENMFGSDLARALLSHRPMSQKAWDIFLEIWNIPRTLMASGEISASLRQGAFILPSHPRVWGKSMWAQLRAVAREKNAIAIDRMIQTNPGAELRAQYGVFHAPISGVGSKLTQREEVFVTTFFERFVGWWEKEGLIAKGGTVPFYLIAKGIRISERAYITFLNKMRAEIFDTTVATWEKTGVPPTPEELKRLASFVNNSTGRGSLWKLEDAAPVLSGSFFSPRLQASRILLFTDAIKDTIRAVNDLSHGRPVNRMSRENLKAVVAFVGVGLLVLGLAKLNGAEVEGDPNSADFGKIKMGKTRMDIWGSFQPYARFTSNMITSMRTSTITGATYEVTRMDILKNFVRSKLMPTTGFIYEVLEGRTYKGEDIELSVEQASEKLVPMFWQDLQEAIESEGLVGGFKASPGFLGVGIQTYDLPSWPELEGYFNIEDTVDSLGNVTKTATKKRLEYRIANPENEAKLFILGRFTTLKTPAAKAAVLRLMEEHKIEPKDVRGFENVFGKEYVPAEGVPEAVAKWQSVRYGLNTMMLRALDRLWFRGGSLMPHEEEALREVHKMHSLGQPDFNKWVKQRLRQVYDNALTAK